MNLHTAVFDIYLIPLLTVIVRDIITGYVKDWEILPIKHVWMLAKPNI